MSLIYTDDFASRIARICHEADRAFSEATGNFETDPWEMLPVQTTELMTDRTRLLIRGAKVHVSADLSNEEKMRLYLRSGIINSFMQFMQTTGL